MGFALPDVGSPLPSPNPRTGYWSGWGGSRAFIDVDAQVSFAYVMNRMAQPPTGRMRADRLLVAAYAAMA
jgi:CubicO group peptidase (beta-lactamase class C family)